MSREQTFTILGRLDDLNTYTSANRTNAYKGAKMKGDNEKVVKFYAKLDQIQKIEHYPIHIKIKWYEKDKRRDIDNITFAVKFINDALVKLDILKDDNQKCINSIEHEVLVDKENPRIEVTLIEQ